MYSNYKTFQPLDEGENDDGDDDDGNDTTFLKKKFLGKVGSAASGDYAAMFYPPQMMHMINWAAKNGLNFIVGNVLFAYTLKFISV